MTPYRPIKIAISGEGLAGATLANALLKHPQLDVHIFESASEFSERGAVVGIANIAQATLSEIRGTVENVLERAGGVTMTSSRIYAEQRGIIVHRAALLDELLKPITADNKHTNKRVVRIVDSPTQQLTIHFDDESQFEADAIIGADGAKGLLGEEYFENDRQYGWIGNGGFFMHDVLDEGETVQCVLSAMIIDGD
ncbi:hypothetical protein P280DRAFT_532497 [Massarina eburnea CBS 473.64]|uniref:FAD-binding domain-containing protein n=1 Tax=Massarina eburnea CBS 473.64 TaxID=1395130 RepID=A0A6A6RNL3_9PLEO|nr:hypothetical protein P280DRAFT_532497 [Massarina eburnea CBS 473.64]